MKTTWFELVSIVVASLIIGGLFGAGMTQIHLISGCEEDNVLIIENNVIQCRPLIKDGRVVQ